jgi:WD40 repeat protein
MNVDPKQLLARYQPRQVKVLNLDRQMTALRFSPCGRVLAAGGQDGSVRRWDATTDAFTALPPLTGHDGWVQALAFHPDRRRLFTVDSWGRVCCWPYCDKEARPLWSIPEAHDGWVRGVAVSADGRTLATCGADRQVRLWSAETGAKVEELDGHGQDVFAVAFHPGGKSLVSGDLKGTIKQWDLATGKAVRDLDARVLYKFDRLQDVGGVRCLAFDPAGEVLVCGGGQPQSGGFVQATPLLLLFRWASGAVSQTLRIGGTNDGFVHDVSVHADGFIMGVTSGQPGSGKLFFHRPGDAQPFFLDTTMANCHALAVHPQGRRLVVSATNRGSNGNGRVLNKNKEYPGNFSPLHVWDMPADRG